MSSQKIAKIAVTMGDPAGIGPEIVLKSLTDPLLTANCEIIVCGAAADLRRAATVLGLALQISPDPVLTDLARRCGAQSTWQAQLGTSRFSLWEPGPGLLTWLADHAITVDPAIVAEAHRVADGSGLVVPGTVSAAAGLAGFLSIALAAALCQDASGECRVMVTAPIHKESLQAAKVPFIGHTEILGGLSGVDNPLTMFETQGLRIFFHSRHVSLRKACDLITTERVLDSIRRCHQAMQELGLPRLKLAVAGLNPHCGEHGLFGTEDDDAVSPAVELARSEGIDVTGPIGADSVFFQARTGRFDAVLSLYHDQGHIAAKTFDFDRTISLTLGLPYLRTSVDHGTAMDIAGTGVAREISMREAILVARRYAGIATE